MNRPNRTRKNLSTILFTFVLASIALAGCLDAPAQDGEDDNEGQHLDHERVASLAPDNEAPPLMQPDDDGIVRIELVTKEVIAPIAGGVDFHAWTFDGTVPGPMLRVKQGDTVEITVTNPQDSHMVHSIDLHAVTGPGGGAEATQVGPGQSDSFRFKAINAGLFVYHCATAHVPSHVANGMYGMILVEPEEGLPEVDKEFYVMQGEWYTEGGLKAKGYQEFSLENLLAEKPTFITFNGAVGALTGDGALRAEVGDTVRIYFGVGGAVPSSFHVIGEIFDRVYPEGGFPPNDNVQTTFVPAGGATMVEFGLEVPGTYVLVDHTLTRAIDRGAAGHLIVSGDENPEVFTET